jgi:hypothetical protein
LLVESLITNSSKSSNYTVVAFSNAVVLVSGSGAIVNNIAVAVFSDVAVVVTSADIGWIGIASIVSKISS